MGSTCFLGKELLMGIETLEFLSEKYRAKADVAYDDGDFYISENWKSAADLIDEAIYSLREVSRLTLEKQQA